MKTSCAGQAVSVGRLCAESEVPRVTRRGLPLAASMRQETHTGPCLLRQGLALRIPHTLLSSTGGGGSAGAYPHRASMDVCSPTIELSSVNIFKPEGSRELSTSQVKVQSPLLRLSLNALPAYSLGFGTHPPLTLWTLAGNALPRSLFQVGLWLASGLQRLQPGADWAKYAK